MESHTKFNFYAFMKKREERFSYLVKTCSKIISIRKHDTKMVKRYVPIERNIHVHKCQLRFYCQCCFYISISLKLVHTNLNYPVLGTSTAAIFLSYDHSFYAPITSDECHAWFHLYKTSWPARSAWKAKKHKMKILAHSGTRTHNFEIHSQRLYWMS